MPHLDTTSLSLVLTEQIACVEAILDTLDREHQALLSGDVKALNASGADKSALVESLELLERQRRELVDDRAAGDHADPHDGAATRMDTPWQRLLELLEACRQRNLRNGAALNARRLQVLHALRLMQGQEALIYGARGLDVRSAHSSPLAKA